MDINKSLDEIIATNAVQSRGRGRSKGGGRAAGGRVAGGRAAGRAQGRSGAKGGGITKRSGGIRKSPLMSKPTTKVVVVSGAQRQQRQQRQRGQQ